MFDDEFFNILLESTTKLLAGEIDEDTKIRLDCNIESLLMQLDDLDDLSKKRKYLDLVSKLKDKIIVLHSDSLFKPEFNDDLIEELSTGNSLHSGGTLKSGASLNNRGIQKTGTINAEETLNSGEMLIFSRKLRKKAAEFNEMIKKDSAVLFEGLKGVETNVAGLDRNIHKITDKKREIPVFALFVLALIIFFVMYCFIYIF